MSLPFNNNDKTRQFSCFICGEIHETYQEFCDHVLDSHEQNREFVVCPLKHCGAPCRDLRAHFKRHVGIPLPKNCQLKASVWFDQARRKKKPTFAEGNYISKKNNNQPMHYRSGYELKVYQILERLGEVLSYHVEPFTIDYYFRGKKKTYIPDLMVIFADGSKELWEIKPANQCSVPQIKAKKAAAEGYCLSRGFVYKMITEGVIDKLEHRAKMENTQSE